jgi:hypothetical protein
MNVFNGMKVIVTPWLDNVPRMQLSEKVKEYLTPDVIAETNRWMLEFFGTKSEILVLQESNAIMMGPKSHAKLVSQTQPQRSNLHGREFW